jgi:hypothetical protein
MFRLSVSDKETQIRQYAAISESQIRQLAAICETQISQLAAINETQKDIISILKSKLTAKTLDFEFFRARCKFYLYAHSFYAHPHLKFRKKQNNLNRPFVSHASRLAEKRRGMVL